MNVLARINRVSESPSTDMGTPKHLDSKPLDSKPLDPTPQERPVAKPSRAHGPSIISAGLTVTGRLESTGDIQIDGKIEGDVRGQAVRIAEGGVVTGTVMGEIVELAGTVEGKVEAETVTLTKTARMSGDIVHESLRIETGAHFDGKSRPQAKKNVTKAANPVEAVRSDPPPAPVVEKAAFSHI